MKWVVGIAVLAGCVADVPDRAPPPNPVPPGEDPGTDQEQDQGNQTNVTATGYLTQIAMIHCEMAFSCRATYPNDSATFLAVWQASVDACVANLQAAWGSNQIEAEIAKGRIDFDGTAAVQCLAGVAFGACTTHWIDGIQWAESCYNVMVGNVPVGGSCDSLYACQSSDCDLTQHVCI